MTRKKSNSKSHFEHGLNLLAGLTVLAIILSACSLPFAGASTGATPTLTEEQLVTPNVDIQFNLTLPTALGAGERVVLEVVDEVTGLPYNTRQYDLTPVSANEYTTTLGFPQGSVLKYRYVKIGTGMVPEATLLSDEVRYRMLSTEKATNVTDHLQFWQDAPRQGETGTLTGQITSAATGQPLSDILVSAAGNLTFTDANGRFTLSEIFPGVHNVVIYAMDGAYATFQQGASVVAGETTPVEIALTPRETVAVTFNVTPPNDALGIPIYMAGNIFQLGNTFSNLQGGMSIDPKQMPLLVGQSDNTFSITLNLYAGLDLRYKFTLGDGYWNAEQAENGGWKVRQLIVPDHDVTLDLTIADWRSSDAAAITFEITIPPEVSTGDEKFIQFKTREWTQPLPLWPLGDGQYLYILFSPLDRTVPIAYRFCRNENCEQALNAEALAAAPSFQPTEIDQTIQLTLSEWANWQPVDGPAEVVVANVPPKDSAYRTQIELTPEMDPTWRVYAPIGISEIAEIDANAIQFTPQWFWGADDRIQPQLGATPFTYILSDLITTSQSQGLSVSLFPQVGPTDNLGSYWATAEHSTQWWESWFTSYKTFILNYAQVAADTGVEQLVLGSKAVLPAFSGGYYLDGNITDAPASLDSDWTSLIGEVRAIFTGDLVWATNAQVSVDPLPEFIDQFDAIYVTVDAPLATADLPTADLIAANFWEVLNTQVYPIYESTGKPILLALGYPSTANAVEGCLLIDEACSNDGVFLPAEVSQAPVDLSLQVSIYNALLPIVADQDWVSGISIRGYNPVVTVMDGSSSIAGKPARDVIWYWFAGLTTVE